MGTPFSASLSEGKSSGFMLPAAQLVPLGFLNNGETPTEISGEEGAGGNALTPTAPMPSLMEVSLEEVRKAEQEYSVMAYS